MVRSLFFNCFKKKINRRFADYLYGFGFNLRICGNRFLEAKEKCTTVTIFNYSCDQ
jgi:hypothetical protein